MQAIIAWATPKLFSFASEYFEESKLEALLMAILETAVKASKTKLDDEVLDLYRKKLEE
jgi:hypothetical protein